MHCFFLNFWPCCSFVAVSVPVLFVHRLLTVVASLVEHRLSMWGLPGPGIEPGSPALQ